MSRVVGIGACVFDTLYTVPSYPNEDTKLRACSNKQAGGGPTATALVAVSKLGLSSSYIGVLSNDAGGVFLKNDFIKYGVNIDNIVFKDNCRSFSSVILLNNSAASRTCVFDKGNLPELVLEDFQKKSIKEADVLMIDGNEINAAVEGAKIARESGTKVLYDCGGLYDNVEYLLKESDIIIPSEEFSLGFTGCRTADEAAVKLYNMFSPDVVVITQGVKGGILYDGKKIMKYPAFKVNAVDTNGSGDVFHGAFAAAVINNLSYYDCCIFSSAVSALKCLGIGSRESIPSFDTVKKFLKENGYEF